MSVIRTLKRWEWAAVLIALGLLVYWLVTAVVAFAGSTVSYTGYDGPVLVSADGRTVTVGGFSYPCFGSVALDVHESPQRIGLRLKWTTPNKHGVCTASMALVMNLEARLSAPVGQRTLVDADDGHALSWFDGGRVLHPTRLPAGYVPNYSAAFVFSHGISTGVRAGCTQIYEVPGSTEAFEIIQTRGPLGDAAPALGRSHSAVTVRGRPGDADANSIRWTDGDVSSYIGPYDVGSPLTAAELVAIADSAPQPPI